MFSDRFRFLDKRLIKHSLKNLEPYLRDVTIELPLFSQNSDRIVSRNVSPAIDAFSYILQQADDNAETAFMDGVGNESPLSMQEKFDQMADNLNGLTIEPAPLSSLAIECEDMEQGSRVLGCFVPRQRKILLWDEFLSKNPAASLYTLQHELAHAIQPCYLGNMSPESAHSAEFRYTLMSLLENNGTIRPSIMNAVLRDFSTTLKDRNIYAWETPLARDYDSIVYYSSSQVSEKEYKQKTESNKDRKNGLNNSLKAISFSGQTNLFNAFRGFSYGEILDEITFATQRPLNQTAPNAPFIFFDGSDFVYGDGVHKPDLLTFTEAIVLLSF